MIDTQAFQNTLVAEKIKLEQELATVGRKNPTQAGDWEGVEPALDTDTAERAETAEALEGFENNTAILNQLEIRLKEINVALEKISVGGYGLCGICGKEIEADRLAANPAALTCVSHM